MRGSEVVGGGARVGGVWAGVRSGEGERACVDQLVFEDGPGTGICSGAVQEA